MDTTTLESAYRSLLAVAGAGGFRAPADRGAWPAEIVLAHLVAKDRLLAAVTARLLAGQRAAYDDAATRTQAYLHVIARAAGDWGGLVATARGCALEVVLLARQLSGGQAVTTVPTRIADGQAVRVDGPVPWAGVLNTHAEVDVPALTDRLGGLR